MRKYLSSLIIFIGLIGWSGAAGAVATSYVDAKVTPLPTIDAQTLRGQGQDLAQEAQKSAITKAQEEGKAQMRKTMAGMGIPVAALGSCTPLSEGAATEKIASNLMPMSAPTVQGAVAPGAAKVPADQAAIIKQVESSKVSANVTILGLQYEAEKEAYMRQENVVDALAKVDQFRAALGVLEKELNKLDSRRKPTTHEDALREDLKVLAFYSEMLSTYDQMKAALDQYKAAAAIMRVENRTTKTLEGAL